MPRRADPNLADSVSLTIRFPKWLHDAIKEKADKNRRSFNAQALLELEEDFAQFRPSAQSKNTIS